MIRHLIEKLATVKQLRSTLQDLAARGETLRKRFVEVESRAESLTKQLAKLQGGVESFSPMLTSVMREGVPLEIFSRLALLDAGYDVKGKYSYVCHGSDGTWIERSVDIYARRERIYTVPKDGGRRAGDSWPERDHLLLEAKQRRAGVTWVFCHLPSSEKPFTAAPPEVPRVNFGFELRPGEMGPKPAGNTKDVENGIAQLEYANLPKLVDLHKEWQQDYKHMEPLARSRHPPRQDGLWNVLVTNARLVLFRPPTTLAELEGPVASKDECLFVDAPWLVYKSDPSLSLLNHQGLHAAPIRHESVKPEEEIPVIMADHTPEIHVVNFDHLPRFLNLVSDPPRIEEIVINLTIDGKASPPFTIK